MASSKERDRWERWFTQVGERVQRQKGAITRLVLINTESVAALGEIAAMERGHDPVLDGAIERAQEALDRIGASAAAAVSDAEELVEAEDPEDPRRKY